MLEPDFEYGPKHKSLFHRYILSIHLSRHQNILVAQIFLKSLVEKYEGHVVYSDGGTWYPEACRALGLERTALSL
jgi:transposase-like protein